MVVPSAGSTPNGFHEFVDLPVVNDSGDLVDEHLPLAAANGLVWRVEGREKRAGREEVRVVDLASNSADRVVSTTRTIMNKWKHHETCFATSPPGVEEADPDVATVTKNLVKLQALKEKTIKIIADCKRKNIEAVDNSTSWGWVKSIKKFFISHDFTSWNTVRKLDNAVAELESTRRRLQSIADGVTR